MRGGSALLGADGRQPSAPGEDYSCIETREEHDRPPKKTEGHPEAPPIE
jgi:hypothetical protein